MPFNKKHFDCEGPLGLPMKDAQAKLLESLLGTLPAEDRTLTRAVKAAATTEVMDGERFDVSWITTPQVSTFARVFETWVSCVTLHPLSETAAVHLSARRFRAVERTRPARCTGRVL